MTTNQERLAVEANNDESAAFTGQASSPLRRVEWLAALLDLSPCQTYDAIASKQVPDDCVVRIGRRLRIIEARVNAWLGLDQFGGQRLQTGT